MTKAKTQLEGTVVCQESDRQGYKSGPPPGAEQNLRRILTETLSSKDNNMAWDDEQERTRIAECDAN